MRNWYDRTENNGDFSQLANFLFGYGREYDKNGQVKLGEDKKVAYHIGDFHSFDFDQEYDVIISSLALHHLAEDKDKR